MIVDHGASLAAKMPGCLLMLIADVDADSVNWEGTFTGRVCTGPSGRHRDDREASASGQEMGNLEGGLNRWW
ncbi:hypothetical protein B0T19DRAFT_410443 [Cercophora scortea]|uniref:Uncharacterized protein n=1 Tax=Cercophora scortea TaxID=314031 RepID=A0AAE0J558_9PEZI|nr:hypothetical protein B0T19DRAFT_410443 [Cercophora scortea]